MSFFCLFVSEHWTGLETGIQTSQNMKTEKELEIKENSATIDRAAQTCLTPQSSLVRVPAAVAAPLSGRAGTVWL